MRACGGASLLEGLDEMLTVVRFKLPTPLRRSLACTNAIENMMGTVRRIAVQRHAQTQSVKLSRFCIHGVVDFKNFFQVRDVRLREINRGVLLGQNDLKFVTGEVGEHVPHEFRRAVRFLEHSCMVRAKRQKVLIVPLLQLGQELDFFEVIGAVIELKWHWRLAYLANHIAIACVLLTEILGGFFLHGFTPD